MAIYLNILSKFDAKGIANAETGFDRLHKSVNSFSKMAGVAFAAAGAAAIAFGISSAKAAADSEAVGRSLLRMAENSAAFAATTPNVGKAVDEIMNYTKSLSNLYGIDDEILNGVVRGWMAVPELAGKGVKGIENMVQVVADVAAGTGKDIESIGLAFVKVAGDEETALGKLLRMGIVFTDQQKAQYEQILATNGEVAAQDYLIGELGTTYAGAAEAAANPFSVLTQNVQNLQEQVGVYLLPILQTLADKFQELVDQHGPELETVFQGIADVIIGVVDGFAAFANWYAENPELFNNLAAGLGIVTGAMWLLNIAMDANPIGVVIIALTALAALIYTVAANWDWLSKNLENFWNDVVYNISNGMYTMQNIVIGVLNSLLAPLNGLIDVYNALFGADIQHYVIPAIDQRQAAIDELQREGIMFGWGGSTNPAPATILGPSVSAGMPRFMAAGGIVTGPTPAIIGEAGPEAVIPLDRLNALGFGNGTTYNISINGGLATSAEVGQMVVSAIKRYERSNGSVFVAA